MTSWWKTLFPKTHHSENDTFLKNGWATTQISIFLKERKKKLQVLIIICFRDTSESKKTVFSKKLIIFQSVITIVLMSGDNVVKLSISH